MIVLGQLHLIQMVDLKNHLIPGTEGDHSPSDVTDTKMLNPDVFQCLFVKPFPKHPAVATEERGGASRLVPFLWLVLGRCLPFSRWRGHGKRNQPPD